MTKKGKWSKGEEDVPVEPGYKPTMKGQEGAFLDKGGVYPITCLDHPTQPLGGKGKCSKEKHFFVEKKRTRCSYGGG